MERYTRFPFNCQWSIDPTEKKKVVTDSVVLKISKQSVKFSDIQLTLIHEFRDSNSGRDKRPFCSPNFQNGSGAHPTSYAMGTRVLSRSRAAGEQG